MQQRSRDTRKQIIEAAVALFCEAGYEAASVADICDRAGVSKGAFYHHFPSKQALFLDVLEDWLGRIDAQLFSPSMIGGDVPASILNMAEMLGFVFREASGRLPIFMEFMVQASRDQAVWNAAIQPYRRYQNRFAELIANGQKSGSIKENLDPHLVARVLVSLAAGILLQAVVDPRAADWEKVTREGIRMITEKIRRSS